MPARARILSTSTVHQVAHDILSPECDLIIAPDERPETLRRLVAEADALIVRVRLPDDIFEHASKLKACVRHGVGLDYIPVEAATQAGVPVANLPDSNTQAVVEHVVASVLMLARDLHRFEAAYREEGWSVRYRANGMELSGRTVGIVGLGRIGRGVAAALHGGFGMKVLGYDKFEVLGLPKFIKPVSLEEVFAGSDFITLHAPLLPETKGLVNTRLLEEVKPGAFLINAARGGLVDDEALIAALRSGRLKGAALDVFEPEPLPSDHPYFRLRNLTLTPHLAAFTEEGLVRMSSGAAEAVLSILRGERPASIVNPEVWEKYLARWGFDKSR